MKFVDDDDDDDDGDGDDDDDDDDDDDGLKPTLLSHSYTINVLSFS